MKIGTKLKDLNGAILKCVNADGVFFECKYVNEGGQLSEGSVFLVKSHLKHYTILN